MLPAGTRIGAYEIVALLGAGGMGEVYRARDPRLKRDVALKILPDAFATDPERLARFQREAEVLASLNHPHIAHVYGIEDGPSADVATPSVRALVMEVVEGETLADRIGRGSIPVDEALPLARQIAEALEAAHERGIVHRDLKPGNIKVTPDGAVKVLDFGLAKALEPSSGANTSPDGASFSPTTMSPAVTMRGVIMGTAAYMSPEQAKGRFTDRRTDIWAFGCVLFEMLTGDRTFGGEDVADTMVAILSKEPDWSRLPANAAAVRPLLARCLQRDPRQRLQAIGDARIQLDETIRDPRGPVPASGFSVSSRRRLVLTAVAAATVAGVVTAGVMWIAMEPVAAPVRSPVIRFEIVPPAQALTTQVPDRSIAISPDGTFIVYRGAAPPHLLVRGVGALEVRSLDGTANARSPFFSPDGRWVGFFEGLRLRKVSIDGGPPVTLCASHIERGASWGEDGTIVFATQDTATGLLRVSAAGGEPTVLTTPDPSRGERDHVQPSWLPGSQRVLFTIAPTNVAEPRQVAVLDLQNGERKTLIRGGSQPAIHRDRPSLVHGRRHLERRAVRPDSFGGRGRSRSRRPKRLDGP